MLKSLRRVCIKLNLGRSISLKLAVEADDIEIMPSVRLHLRPVLLGAFTGLTALFAHTVPVPAAVATVAKEESEPLAPLPSKPVGLSPAKVKLGARLFAEKRLSGNRRIACTSCHDFSHGADDGLSRSRGVGGEMATNAPTVFNVSYNLAQFWDGRGASLEEQMRIAVESPVAMAGKWEDIVRALGEDESYRQEFKALYPEGITPASLANAVAEFERSLITPNAPIDRYLRGDKAALSAAQIKGYGLFKEYGCVACHQGVNVGGNMYQTMGAMRDFFRERGREDKADQGRYNVTKAPEDRHVFKVPGLRNVALTAPYFHDGSVKTLRGAIRIMAKYQLGRKISEEDVAAIETFLQSLTGDLPDSVKEAGFVPSESQ